MDNRQPPKRPPNTDEPDVIVYDPGSPVQRRRKKSVFQYIAVLFAAAFLLMLYTFLLERRQHEILQEENLEQISNLQQSVSAVQSLENLYQENEALREEADSLRDENAALSKQYEDIQAALRAADQNLKDSEENRELALTLFVLEQAMGGKQYEQAAGICAQLQEKMGGGVIYTAGDLTVDTDARFQEITERLVKSGWLTQDEGGRLSAVSRETTS